MKNPISLRLAGVFLGGFALFFLSSCAPSNGTPQPFNTNTAATSAPDDTEVPSPTPEPTIDPNLPVVLNIYLGTAPATLDPLFVSPRNPAATDLADNLFAGLTQLDPVTGGISPVLATDWQPVDESGLVWNVFMRDDVSWVAVDPGTGVAVEQRRVTANDVVNAVRRGCSSAALSEGGSTRALFLIDGCERLSGLPANHVTLADYEQQLGIRVLNDVAFELRLTEPTAMLPTLLAMPAMRPVPQEVLVESGGENWAAPETIWTSGPYAVNPASTLDDLQLVQNPLWPGQMGNVAEITVRSSEPDPLIRFESGTMALSAIPAGKTEALNADGTLWLACPVTTMAVLSYEAEPFNIAEARRAFSLALDREAVAMVASQPLDDCWFAVPAQDIAAPGSIGAAASPQLVFDLDEASAELAEPGYGACVGVPVMTIRTDASMATIAENMAAQWTQNLNCTDRFEIETAPLNDILVSLRRVPEVREPARPAITLFTWQADLYDVEHWYRDVLACRNESAGAYLNQGRGCIDADGALRTLAEAGPNETRADSMGEIYNAFFGREGEMPVLPLYHWARAVQVQPWLTVPGQSSGTLHFDTWQVDAREVPPEMWVLP